MIPDLKCILNIPYIYGDSFGDGDSFGYTIQHQ